MPERPHTVRRLAVTIGIAAAAAAVATAAAPSAAATDGATFTFPRLGTVVVNGTVDDAVNFTVYRILDDDCTGTAFPGPDNSCVPQEATDTLIIPAGTYTNKKFRLDDVPTCGPTQQDVYDGAYQPTVTASGTHQYLAGGILQLGTCATSTPSSSPSPSSDSSSPRSTPSTSAPSSSTPPPSTPAASTPASTPAGTPSASASFTSEFDATANNANYPAATSPQLASTGTDHTTTLLLVGLGAVALGGTTLAAGRSTRRHH